MLMPNNPKVNSIAAVLFTISCCFFIFFVFVATAYAEYDDGYDHESNNLPPNPEWMAQLPDNAKILRISIPGTHDSGARIGGDIIATQTHTISQQLMGGVRYFDLRARQVKDRFQIYHGIANQFVSFRSVLRDLQEFLGKHGSETVLIRVKQEESPIDSSRSFSQIMQGYVDEFPDLFLLNADVNTSLGEARGMAVILRDFSIGRGEQNFGIRYNRGNFDIQDDYTVSNNWALYHKWQEVKDQIIKANKSKPPKGFINYLSASTGALPYFIASGRSSPQTGAPHLFTGYIQSKFSDKYPDFPRRNCIGSVCSIFFEGVNTLTKNYLKAHQKELRFIGIMAADFPGPGLIRSVISINTFLAEKPYCEKLEYQEGNWVWHRENRYKNQRLCAQKNDCQNGGQCLRWYYPQGKCQYLGQLHGQWQWLFYPKYQNRKTCEAADRCRSGGACFRWYLL